MGSVSFFNNINDPVKKSSEMGKATLGLKRGLKRVCLKTASHS